MFFENVMFYSSLKTCNEWVSAYSLVFWIYLSFFVMLILRVQSLAGLGFLPRSAYSRINTATLGEKHMTERHKLQPAIN